MRDILNIKNQRGNVFTVLLAGVAMAGMLSVVLYQVISGPMSSVVRVSNNTMTKNQIQSISNIVIINAANQANNGDCDKDGQVEPSEWRPKGTKPAPTNGGLIPDNIGAPQTDPWGTEYGYCVWDIGSANDPTTEVPGGACGAPADRLSGTPDPSLGKPESQVVLAIVSAGPDRAFNTECRNYDPANPDNALLVGGGDDIVQKFTYNEASSAISSLWKLQQGNPSIAEIDKNITVGNPTNTPSNELTDTSGIIRSIAVVTQGLIQAGGAIRLADNSRVTSCVLGNAGDMRFNNDEGKKILEVCNGSEWVPAGGGSGAHIDNIRPWSIPFADADGNLIEDDAIDANNHSNLYFDTANDILRVGKKISFVTTTGNQPVGTLPDKFTLDMFDDVTVNAAANTQMLVYNSATKQWVNVNQPPVLWLQNGTNAYYNAGNVGIGTSSPISPLTISSNDVNSIRLLGSSANSIGMAMINSIANGRSWTVASSGGSGSTDVGSFIIYDNTAPALRFVISPSGFVGIGTPTPTVPLHVASTTASALYLRSGAMGVNPFASGNIALFSSSQTTGNLILGASAANSYYLQSAKSTTLDGDLSLNPNGGNVGIGTATPTTKLEVAGSVKVTGAASTIVGAARGVDGTQMKICAGKASTGWVTYESGGDGVYITIDTSGCGFTSLPIYVVSLGCATSCWVYPHSIYANTITSFRVYVYAPTLTAAQAVSRGFYIAWSAYGN